MTKRVSISAAACLLLAVVLFAPGCGKKEDKLDVQAPPPSTPNAQREVSPTKRRPMAPPTMGGPPRSK